MNCKAIATAAFLGLAIAAPAANASEPHVTPHQRAALIAKEQGPEALRHFIMRTRMIYALNFSDFYKPQQE